MVSNLSTLKRGEIKITTTHKTKANSQLNHKCHSIVMKHLSLFILCAEYNTVIAFLLLIQAKTKVENRDSKMSTRTECINTVVEKHAQNETES